VKSILELPKPTSRTASGPVVTSRDAKLIVDYDYQDDDGSVHWVRILFEHVLLFEYRQQSCCDADVISDDTRTVSCLSDSPRLTELRRRWQETIEPTKRQERDASQDTFKQFDLYFDDAACVEVIARSMSSSLLLDSKPASP